MLKGAKQERSILCVQETSSKKIPTISDFITANKQSFGSAIGTITNYATSMYNVMAKFEKGSKEYEELSYRLKCMQDFQQNEIDRAKGIVARPVPKEWYDFKINKIEESDSEEVKQQKLFNLSILANKKPYFFIYNYPKLMKEHKDYMRICEDNCGSLYLMSIKELRNLENKTEEQQNFVDKYMLRNPTNLNSCLMNEIAWYVESHFENTDRHKLEEFNHENLKTKTPYTTQMYNKIKKIKSEYDQTMQDSIKNDKNNVVSGGKPDNYATIERVKMISAHYTQLLNETCPNEEALCNILVDMCYTTNKSKRFVWDSCRTQIIRNLLQSNNNVVSYPVSCDNGNISFKGNMFKMVEVLVDEIDC